jgi:hypothetical protein
VNREDVDDLVYVKLPFAPADQPIALFVAVVVCLFTVVMSWRNPLKTEGRVGQVGENRVKLMAERM